MYGIDLNEELSFIGASMRIFKKGEKHVTRHIDCNVLIVMFDGVLKFSENNIEYEVSPGEYFIQKADCFQEGKVESDEPKYFYIHFRGDFKESDGNILNRRGEFDINKLKPLCDLLDKYCHSDYTLSEKLVKFYEILNSLYVKPYTESEIARNIRKYIENNYLDNITLEKLSKEFSFSKNHIINIFKKEYKLTPFEYINLFKIKKCEYLLEVTSESIENIAYSCGFNDYSQFYRLFVKKNNMTPKSYRAIKSYK